MKSRLSAVAGLAVLTLLLGVEVNAALLGSSRKLLATLTQDYTAFCAGRPYSDFAPEFTTKFDVTNFKGIVDVCNNNVIIAQSGEAVLSDTAALSGLFVEEDIPGGRKLTLHITGSGVYAIGIDVGPDQETSQRFVGIAPNGDGYLAFVPALSKAELALVIAKATSFTYDLSWEQLDGSKPGDPTTLTYNDIFDSSKATILLEEIFVTFTGPVIPGTTRLNQYPLGNSVIVTQHQKTVLDETPFNDITFNLLSPDTLSTQAAAIITRVRNGNSPPTTASPSGLPVGGTCDATSASPNQCFNDVGSSYICCPAGCPPTPGANPTCV